MVILVVLCTLCFCALPTELELRLSIFQSEIKGGINTRTINPVLAQKINKLPVERHNVRLRRCHD